LPIYKVEKRVVRGPLWSKVVCNDIKCDGRTIGGFIGDIGDEARRMLEEALTVTFTAGEVSGLKIARTTLAGGGRYA
jgi:hypothetical protein